MSRGICHWGPLLALSIIWTLFLCGFYCILLWYPPWTSVASVIHLVVYVSWMILIMNYFIKSITLGPGYLPLGWKPDDDKGKALLQYCGLCKGYKAPRAHHCSKCGRCVMKMDHHCPWINNCVGHFNHRSFTLFLFYVPIGCTHAAVLFICCTVQQFYLLSAGPYKRSIFQRNAIVSFTVYRMVMVLFCIGLSIGVTIAVGILLYYQMKGILTNKTAIEGWIVEKADRHRHNGEFFRYPYNLGWKENFKQVITLWQDYVGDGIMWPVTEGCNQFTLTKEQLEQKKLKRERTICCSVVKSYNGSVIAWREGLRTCISTPWTDEPRIKVEMGDVILVTRWRKWWLYGEKSPHRLSVVEITDEALSKEKGWFPRHCVVRIDEEESAAKKDQ